jgi:hypothetical protein
MAPKTAREEDVTVGSDRSAPPQQKARPASTLYAIACDSRRLLGSI